MTKYGLNVAALQKQSRIDTEALSKTPALDAVYNSPVAVHIEDIIDKLRGDPPEYEPLLFERYLQDASNAVDRALTLRREIQQIELDAVTYAREYLRFEKLANVQEALEAREEALKIAKVNEQGFKEATEAFSKGGSEEHAALVAGFSKQSETLAHVANLTHNDEERRLVWIREKWQLLRQLTEAEIGQHSLLGSPVNLKERKDRLVAILNKELTEAYQKCISVEEGLRVVFEKELPLPKPDQLSALDNMVIWIRNAVEFIERRAEHEVTFTIQIPLTQPFKNYQNERNLGLEGAPATNDLARLLGPKSDGFVSFKTGRFLDESVGAARISGTGETQRLVRHMRVTGVGVSMSIAGIEDYQATTARWLAIVFPPERPRKLAHANARRPPCILGNIQPQRGNTEVQMQYGDEVQNAPAFGEWKVKVMAQTSNSGAADVDRTMHLRDVKLVLQIKGIPNVSSGDW